MARRTLFADPFTGTNADLGATWAPYTDVPGCQKISGVCYPSVADPASDNIEINSTALPNDQWAEATLAVVSNDGFYHSLSVGVRNPASGAAFTAAAYMAFVDGTTPPLQLRLMKNYINQGASAVAPVPGDVIRIEALLTAIKVYLNGVERISITDATYTAGFALVELYTTGASITAQGLTNFSCGDFVAGGAAVHHYRQLART